MSFTALPMEAYAWAEPNIDLEDPHFVITVEWTWPEGDWSYFSLVRSTRSPVRRREEGQVMFEIWQREWDSVSPFSGRPAFRDPQPPPGEWVYYTAFVMNAARIWEQAGSVAEIGIADHDWTLRLPELLPGVAIADRQQTVAPAEHSNTLVEFFQNPGAFLDRAVTMAEATQFFWDPLRSPPQMLQYQLESIGYEYDATLGSGRLRHVIDSLMKPQQGSVPFIEGFVEGVTGCEADVRISNNLMINTDDSSFESGDLSTTKWESQTGLELRAYENWLTPTPVLPPNVLVGHFLYIPDGRTLTCGNADPVADGIPCARWTEARMGCYAFGTGVTLDMGLKLYDWEGNFLRDATILGGQTLTSSWAWYGNADDSAVSLGPSGFAYAVPFITVSNACSVDLLVVDDG